MVPLYPKRVDPVAHNAEAAEDISQPLEQIKLQEANGVRRAIRRALAPLIPAAAIGGLLGAVAGNRMEAQYHEWMDIGHAPSGEIIDVEPAEEEETESSEDGRLSRRSGLLSRAKKTLGEAKKAAKETAENLAKDTETYKKIDAELKRWKELGDKTAFWLPFLMVFLAATILANKIIRDLEALGQSVDPAVAANFRALESTANALVARANALSQAMVDTSGDVRELAEHAQRLVPGLDEAMQSARGKER